MFFIYITIMDINKLSKGNVIKYNNRYDTVME